MEIFFTIISVVLLTGLGFFAYLINKKFRELADKQKNDQGLLMMNQNLQGMQSRLDKTTEAISQRLDNAAHVIHSVSQELGKMQEIGHQMKDFQEFFKSPKLRGNIGEQVLRDLLEQYFPQGQFVLQYPFKSTGERVDAIIKTDKGIIPIDAKFPMENFQKALKAQNEEEKRGYLHEFNKDIKKHIGDISKKYILPQEGTVDFAVMYVPSETVYYEIIRNDEDLDKFARDKKIFIVSPNSFYYFLRVIMTGMEGRKIEEASKKILQTLNAIQKDAQKFGEALGILTSHITHAKTTIDKVNNEYSKLSGKIDNIKLLE